MGNDDLSIEQQVPGLKTISIETVDSALESLDARISVTTAILKQMCDAENGVNLKPHDVLTLTVNTFVNQLALLRAVQTLLGKVKTDENV